MKNFFRIVMLALVVCATSCAREDISSNLVGGGDAIEVTFTADLGELGTRTATVGDGSHVDRVYLGIYENNLPLNYLDNLTEDEGYLVTDGKATFSVVLLKDKVYDLVFWAQKAGLKTTEGKDVYNMDWAKRELTVDYTGVLSQAEERDAFYLVQNGFKAGHDETVFKLYRPFAQLNAGLSKVEVENITHNGVDVKSLKSKAVVRKVANKLFLGQDNHGKIDKDNLVEVEFGSAAKPAEELKVSSAVTGGPFEYVSLNYLLVNEEQLVEVDYTFTDNEGTNYERTYYSVPVKRNYRTNIVGALLSSPIDFTVEIVPEFTNSPEEDYNREVWDGKSVSAPVQNANGEYEITDGAELAWLAGVVNGTISRAEGDQLKDLTFVLTEDIDLGNKPWTMIGDPTNYYKEFFAGILDGNGKTIRNLNVVGHNMAGLFGPLHTGATIKNLTIDGATITSNHYAGVIAAWVETGAGANIIENCHVKNATVVSSAELVGDAWDNGDKAGAICGFMYKGTIKDCSATNVSISAYRDFGGIVGYAKGSTISGNTIENVTLTQDNAHNYKNYTKLADFNIGHFVGRNDGSTLTGNNGTAQIVINLEGLETTPEEMLQVDGAVVTLPEGEYTLPSDLGDSVTIEGAEGANVVINAPNAANLKSNDVTFRNVTINKSNSNYNGFQHSNVMNYEDCVINNQIFLYGQNETFTRCTFNQASADAYNVWTYGARNVTFNECTFNSAGKSVLVYNEGHNGSVVTFNDCTLNASAPANDGKAAIEVDSSLLKDNMEYVVNINNTTATGFDEGSVSGNTLWNNKKGDRLTVTVDGEVVLANGYVKILADGLYQNGSTYSVTKPAGLLYLSNKTMEDGAVINIDADLDLEGASFKAIAAGYSKSLAVNGNGHTISNVAVEVCGHNSVGSAALFFCYTGGKLNVNNLNVYNVTVPAGTYSGVISGYTQGDVTLENVVVEKCNVKGVKKVGGLVGFVEASTSNFVATNCQVLDTVVEATEKQAGTVFGYLAKPATLNNCVVEGSTAVAPKYCNNGLVSTDPAQAALIVDGVAIRFAEKAETMTAIAKDATIDTNIILASDVTGDATLLQKADIDLVVDGDNHNYTGTIYIHGQARHTGAETLAIQNVNFVSNETIDFISSNTTVSTERYAHNVTIKDCTFTGSGNGDVVGARFRQAYNIAIENFNLQCIYLRLRSLSAVV